MFAPGDTAPRTILRKYNPDGSKGHIVVSREQLFDAIDEWHEHSGHLGQESGSFAGASMPTSPKTMSSSTAKPALLA